MVATIVLRLLLGVSFVMFVIAGLFKMSVGLVFGVAVLLVTLMILSRQLKKQSIMIERTFFQNLRYRDMRAEYMGEKKPEYAGRLLSRDLHLTDLNPRRVGMGGQDIGGAEFRKEIRHPCGLHPSGARNGLIFPERLSAFFHRTRYK